VGGKKWMINRRILNHLRKASKEKDEKELRVAYQCISAEISFYHFSPLISSPPL
jgi:hypothetical protein